MTEQTHTPVSGLWSRVRQFRSVLRLKPFDYRSEQGRANERHRRIALTALTSLAARGIGVMTVLVSVPLTINYLGSERYGLWMTISSVSAILAFADLGLGNGLVNGIAEANGKNDQALAACYAASAFYLLAGIAAALMLLFASAYPWIDWRSVFNISSPQALAEAAPTMLVFVGAFLCNIPLGIVEKVLAGYQEGFRGNLWTAGGNLLGLAGVLVAIHLQAGLPWLVAAMSGGPVLAAAANGAILFFLRRPAILPRWRNVRRDATKRILRLGLLFFVMQLASSVAWGADNFVIAHVLNQNAVAEYSTSRRLFTISPMLVGVVLAPLWPAYSEAVARADMAWVRKTLVRSLVATFVVAGAVSMFLVLFGKPIMRFWVGGAIAPSLLLFAALGIMTTLGQTGAAVSSFLNGVSAMRIQTVSSVLMAATNLPISIYLTRRFGVSGVVWGTIVSATLFSWMPMAMYVPVVLARLQSRARSPVAERPGPDAR